MNGLDWIIVSVFLMFILLMGIYLSKKGGQDTTNFFVAGRKMPWWLAGLSMAATNFASDSPMHMSAMTRRSGILGCWFYFRQMFQQTFSAIFFAKLWTRTNAITDIEFYELRHGKTGAKILRSFIGVYYGLVIAPLRIAIFIIGMRKLCKVLLTLPEFISMPLIGSISSAWLVSISLTLIALIYSAMSGIMGVAWTDFIEYIISIVGTYALLFYGLDKVGGIDVVKQKVTEIMTARGLDFNPFHIAPGSSDLLTFTFLFYVFGFWWISERIDGDRQVAQRFLSARSEKDAVLTGIWNTMATFMLRFWPWFMIGFISLLLFPNLTDHEMAAPMMIKTLLPHGLLGLVFIAFFSAFLSSIDSNFNLGASYVINDLYRRFLVKNKNEKHYMRMSRLATVLVAIIGVFIASQQQGILETLKLAAKLGAGYGIIKILRWFWWRVNAWTELTAILSGFIFTVSFTIMKKMGMMTPAKYIIEQIQISTGNFPYKDLYFSVDFIVVSLLGVSLSFLVMFLTKPNEKEKLISFYRKIRPAGPGWKHIAKQCPDAKSTDSIKRDFISASIVLIFAFSGVFGVGFLFTGVWLKAVILFAICGLFFYIMNKYVLSRLKTSR